MAASNVPPGGERADVQLVDHRPPAQLRGPCQRRSVQAKPSWSYARLRPVHPVRLPGRARVGQRRVVVAEQERVVGAGPGVDVGVPPATVARLHLVVGAADPQTYALKVGAPHRERHGSDDARGGDLVFAGSRLGQVAERLVDRLEHVVVERDAGRLRVDSTCSGREAPTIAAATLSLAAPRRRRAAPS